MPEPKTTLVALDAEYKATVAEIIALGGELTPENELRLAEIETALCAKTDSYGIVQSRLEKEAEYWKEQETHCRQARQSVEHVLARLKDRMRLVLSGNPDKSLQGDLYRFFLAKRAPTVEIVADAVPDEFKTTRIEILPDREKIEEALRAGKEVPGCKLNTDVWSLRMGKPKQ